MFSQVYSSPYNPWSETTLDVIVPLPTTLSPVRKLVVLGVLCSAQFFDIFIANAVVVSLPSLAEDLHFTPGALQWILSAYTLTFASFMLIAGSLSDIFHPKQNPYSASASPLSPYSAPQWGQASTP
ncbi:hypothetical protein PC9H_006994 [Pleurotus ostreatus]|uniref:Major facilitator superfamily (MFS) profile domain-containing protein n=1 Tax=Pleurotus ostreatus TaxID=5322 RepID=A0A8H6ZSL2_PLEOS|nr:uncharacterized protein PC9H_006994 [Pleurotus ostreatus]KAF7427779.1 hypothetical protein PC9H_006994 [Pleurotus ostreatus]KAJ8695750.1 hypothetical protein PTI98_005679 [Pleurotus ostreatus]